MSTLLDNVLAVARALENHPQHAMTLQELAWTLNWSESKTRSIVRTILETKHARFVKYKNGLKLLKVKE
ncbi:MAG: hypothetical protein ACTSPB_10110 [Candidatus Thorarchaeota archaeon]